MEITKDNVMIARPLERLIEVGLGDVYLNVLKSYEDRILEIDANTGEELKADVLVNRAVLLAKWFQKIGIGVGDSVSISSENRLEFCVVPIACFITGATFAPLNPEYTPGELRHVISLSKPKILFCSPQTLDSVIKIFPEHPFIHHLVIFGKTNHVSYIPGCTITLHDNIVNGAESMPIDEEFQATPIDPYETIATILCSSGTTGMPKGVMTTHNNMTAYIEISRQVIPEIMHPESNQEVIMGLAPFFHSMGFMVMMLNLLGGKKFIIQGRFHPRKFLENIAKYKIVTIIAPPPIILFLTKHPLVRNYDVSSIKNLRSGAAPLSREIEMTAKKRLNLKVMTQGYGMTETTLGVCMSVMDQGRVGSVGKLVPGMCAKVIDENGRPLGPNQVGELCFKGPLIMKGYINNPKATAETIGTDGFLHTGDVGYYDKHGFFFVVDRLKELIKYKAFQVPPAELEAILISHPAVQDVGVIGIPNDDVGELATAFVVKKKGLKVTAEELQEIVKANVSRQKQLHGGVRFVESIPRNPTGKILRRVLRQNAKQIKSKL